MPRPAYGFVTYLLQSPSLSRLRHENSRRSPYVALSVTALIGPVTLILTVDLLTSKYRFTDYSCDGLPSCQDQFLGFLDLSVVELGRNTRQTDRRTDRQTPAVIS